MYQINSFNFTVHTEDKTFKAELLKLIKELALVDVGFDIYKNMHMYKLDTSRLLTKECDSTWVNKLSNDIKAEGNDFFSLQIINESDYNFSFQRIAELYSSVKSKKILNSDSFKDTFSVYSRIYGHEWISEEKKNVANRLIKFLIEKQLLSSSKINNMSFIHNLNLSVRGSDSEDAENRKNFKKSALARLIENTNGNLSYNYIKSSVDEGTYTLPVKSYQAYINDPKRMVDQYLKQNNKEPLEENCILDERNMIKYLTEIIKQVIKGRNKFEVKKDDLNGYHVVADASCKFSWNESIEIVEGIFINFRPIFEANKNFFGLSTISETHDMKLYGCEGEITKTEYDKLKDKSEVFISGGDSFTDEKGKKRTIKRVYRMHIHSTKLNMRKKYISIFEVNDWIKKDGVIPYRLDDLDSISLYLHKEILQCIVAKEVDFYDEGGAFKERAVSDCLQEFINLHGITKIENFSEKYSLEDNYIRTDVTSLRHELKSLFE